MSNQLTNPVLFIGIGGAGSKLAIEAKDILGAECLLISHDEKDLKSSNSSIKISTESIINPTVQLIRGVTSKNADSIKDKISNYSTIVLIANLAGKDGAAMAPVISRICKENNKNTVSFAIMPFKYEKDRIFNSGIALKRIRADCNCTVVLDNDALLDSNPDLTIDNCYKIANSAILYAIDSMKNSEIPEDTSILTTSKSNQDLEIALRDSLKMLYEDAPASSVKRSLLHVIGGNSMSVGLLNSISNITRGMFNDENTRVDLSTSSSDESKIIMLSSVQGETQFEKYDPLGVIPSENTLDWDEPDCSIDCKLNLYQLE